MKIKIYLVMVVVFLLGMLSGGLLVVQFVQSKVETLTTSSTREVYELFLERLDNKLDLSDQQEEKISKILEGAADEIEPLRAELRAKLSTLTRENVPKIGRELDPEQQKKFREMVDTIMKRLNLSED